MIASDEGAWFSFRMTMPIQKALEEAGIYFSLKPGAYRVRDGEIIRSVKGAAVEPFVVFNANSIFPCGFASYTNTHLEHSIIVGRYCSIASNVRAMGLDHPTDRFTTNTITYGRWSNIHLNPMRRLGGGEMRTKPVTQKLPPRIEHDVWVGQDVLLARGVTLATGCVVAAGSVVTKSVPPYAVVGGNPARVIKHRFSESNIERLLESRWWEYAFPHFSDLPVDDLDAFLDGIQEMKAARAIQPYEPTKIDVYEVVRRYS